MISLAEMPAGKSGTIVAINGGYGLVKKLDKMGFLIGTEIMKISRQWMRGPVVIRSGNTEIAIGFGMAKKIMVEVKCS
jgi:ferrous iron transport protein A